MDDVHESSDRGDVPEHRSEIGRDSSDIDEPKSPPKEKPRFFSIFNKSYKAKDSAASGSAETRATSPASKTSSLRVGFKLKDRVATVKATAKKQLSNVKSVLQKRRRSSASEALDTENESAEFQPHPTKWATWKGKLIAKDPDVEFFPNNGIDARHSVCGDIIKGKDIYSATRFIKHVDVPGLDIWSKDATGAQVGSSKGKEKMLNLPCPGLTEYDDQRIPTYAERTGAEGGGARSYLLIEKHEYAWRIEHNKRRVFSTRCSHEVSQDHTTLDGRRTLPCSSCKELLNNARTNIVLESWGRSTLVS